MTSSKRAPQAVRFLNAYCLAEANKNRKYQDLLNKSGLNFADGTPVALYMRRQLYGFDLPAPTTVRGPSVFTRMLDQGSKADVRHLMVGSTEETLSRLRTAIAKNHPNANIVGTFSPSFGPVSPAMLDEIVAKVESTKPNCIWVGMGSPKQDWVSYEISRRTGVTCAGVGAAFDFTAGTVKQAPRFLQNTGLEWIYRLVSEPRRLWRRYIFGNPIFVASLIRGHFETGRIERRNLYERTDVVGGRRNE
ncbi:WecB/TagA/CpsF family glycosyltransferase [Rhodococcoides fascians]|uniref:WecB/TagA/CpsF family glycosyltransferase n=1 Tax=Rhodococcoides fascians TaxID=1828 RepID=UPI0037924832